MAEHFKYCECDRGECHTGELLNLVCMESGCNEDNILCCICYDQRHKNHKIKPLKAVIITARQYLNKIKPIQIDKAKATNIINESKAKAIQHFQALQLNIKNQLALIKNTLDDIFHKALSQIELKSGNNAETIEALEHIKEKQIETRQLKKIMKKLITSIYMVEEQVSEVGNAQIEQSIGRLYLSVEKELKGKQKIVLDGLSSLKGFLHKTGQKLPLFTSALQFKFSETLHHNNVTVVNEHLIKATESYSYSFALLEPSLQDKGNKPCRMAFKIKENSSNWLAVGVCYKETVKANDYVMNYMQLGHGAYMVSCNAGKLSSTQVLLSYAGSWSSIDSTKNNTVNAFIYAKGDIIIIDYQPDQSKIIFSKKNSELTHTLEFEKKENDELYLCGLFYYTNDQIQFLGQDNQ